MQIDFKRQWPLFAAIAIGAIALYVYLRGQQTVTAYQPFMTGPSDASIQAAIQGQVAVTQANAQTQQIQSQVIGSIYNSLIQGIVTRDVASINAQANVQAAQTLSAGQVQQANAQLAAEQARVSGQTTLGIVGAVGNILGRIL